MFICVFCLIKKKKKKRRKKEQNSGITFKVFWRNKSISDKHDKNKVKI